MFQVGKLYKSKSSQDMIIMILDILNTDKDRDKEEFTTVKAIFPDSSMRTFSIYSAFWEEVDP